MTSMRPGVARPVVESRLVPDYLRVSDSWQAIQRCNHLPHERTGLWAQWKKIERLEKSVSVHHLAASHHISSVLFTTHRDRDAKMEELQELEAEEKRLLAIDFEGGSSDIPKPKETEEEMLIRTGEMTPFGSTVAPSSSLCAAQPSTSAQLVSQVPPPRKRKKKERLGTVTRRRSTMPQKSRLEEEFVVDLDESDSEVSGQSDEDYLPESLGSDEDDAGDIAIVKERKGRQAKKATSGQLEGPPTKRLKKLTDDGNYAAYLKRLKEQRRLKLLEKHRRIMEDEDSDSESAVDVDEEFCVPKNIWNRLYREKYEIQCVGRERSGLQRRCYQQVVQARCKGNGGFLHSLQIFCAQHDTAAVKRHASRKKHLEAAAKQRDSSGVLLASFRPSFSIMTGTKVPLNPDLLKCVRQAQANYAQRLSLEASSSKRKATKDPVVEQPAHEAAKAALEDQVAASKALLMGAEEIINTGVKKKDMNKVLTGHVLLAKGNASLEIALKRLSEFEEISKKRKH
ncbi:hypothetical protein MRX96_008485 [Rhipicephalus microplus]